MNEFKVESDIFSTDYLDFIIKLLKKAGMPYRENSKKELIFCPETKEDLEIMENIYFYNLL